ncbi:MAG: carboxypeptidase-like regulatory domain-containing protein, partial [Planctomycetota bacterium]
GSPVTLQLAADRRLHGRVLTPAGTPASGAQVEAELQYPGHAFRKLQASCDGEGNYELLLPASEDLLLHVTHGEGSWWDFKAPSFDAAGECAFDVRLATGTTLRGRVVDARTGAPLEGALVGEGWTFQRTTTTAADGTYALAGCVGDHHFYVRAPGYAEGSASTRPEAESGGARLDFALQPGCAAHGRVVDEYGDGVGDAYVALTSGTGTWSSTRSAADGSFAFTDLLPDDGSAGFGHALLVGKPGFATQVHELTPENAEGLHELPALTLRTPELVAGRALDSAGQPVAGALITLSGWNHDRTQWGQHSGVNVDFYVGKRETLTDADGRFWFGDVPPGRYELTGLATGRAESEGQSFVLAAGEPREELVVRFSQHGGTARIFGRVVDEQGNPLAGVRVAVDREGLFDVYLPSTDTGADGTFELGGLLEGPFTLWATGMMLAKEKLWLDTLLPEVSGGPHELVLRRGATIEGRLVQPDGTPAIGRFVALHPASGEGWIPQTSDLLGHFRLLVPHDTTWTVDVYDSNGVLLSVDGVAAGSHDLVWTLPR